MTYLRKVTVLAVLALVLLIPSARAQAATEAELKAQIAALLAQIAALQNGSSGSGNGSSATSSSISLTVSPESGFAPLEVAATVSVDMGTTTCGATTLGYLDWDNGKTAKKVVADNKGCERVKKAMLTYVYDSIGKYDVSFEDKSGNDVEKRVEVLLDDSPYVDSGSTSAAISESKISVGTYVIKYDVTAADDDLYIPANAGSSAGAGELGADYGILGTPSFTGTETAVLQSNAPKSGKYYVVEEGETESFTLTVTIDSLTSGSYKVALERIGYAFSKKAPTDYIVINSTDPDYVTKTLKLLKAGTNTSLLDTYIGYVNGAQVSQNPNMNEERALAGCKALAARYSKDHVRCTWGTKEIYNNQVVPNKTATINAKSLKSNTAYPTISGTATGLSVLGIAIGSGDKEYGSGDLKVVNGKWSVKVDTALRDGTYTVYVYSNNVELTKGTLVVKTSTTQPETPVNDDPNAKDMPIIVGVYEGTYPPGTVIEKHKTPGTVTITLTGPTGPAQPLVLTSYEPVNWVINNPNNVRLTKIVAVGVYKQTVTNAPSGVPVEYYSKEAGTDYQYAYVYNSPQHEKIVAWLARKYKWANSGVFYAQQVGNAISVSLGWKG